MIYIYIYIYIYINPVHDISTAFRAMLCLDFYACVSNTSISQSDVPDALTYHIPNKKCEPYITNPLCIPRTLISVQHIILHIFFSTSVHESGHFGVSPPPLNFRGLYGSPRGRLRPFPWEPCGCPCRTGWFGGHFRTSDQPVDETQIEMHEMQQ